MNVKIVTFQGCRCLRNQVLNQAHRNPRGLFHDIAQLACHGNLPVTFCQQRLNIQDIPSDRSPCKSGHNSGSTAVFHFLAMYRMCIQIFVEILAVNYNLRLRLADERDSCRAAKLIHPLLQSAHACLPRIVIDDPLKRLVSHGQCTFRYSNGLHGFRKQMSPRNPLFLHRRVALELNDLHSVEERLGNRIKSICRANEKHVAQVKRHIQIMVRK